MFHSKPPLRYRSHGPIARATSRVGMFHSVAQDPAASACATPFPHLPRPRNATRISVAQRFTSPANPWKATDLLGHGLCNTHNADVSQGCAGRPLRRIRACATVPAAMVRHVSQAVMAGSGTGMIRARPMKHRRPACFTGLRRRDPDPSLMQGIEAGAALTPGGFPPKRPDHFSRRTAPLEAGATTGPDADARARVFFRTRRVP